MKIKRIKLTNFRNLQNLDLQFNQDFVVLAGPNAAGKTNFLESIFYASVQQAFPPAKAWELIRFGTDHFRVTVETDEHKLEYFYGRKNEKRYVRSQSIDDVRKKSGEMFGVLPTVSFLPQDLNLLVLNPGLRREYLDDILLQTKTDYEDTLMEFGKVLTQRNELLYRILSGSAEEGELDFWDEKFARLSDSITSARQQLVGFFNEGCSVIYKEISGADLDFSILYPAIPSSDTQGVEGYLKLLADSRDKDIRTSQTNIGPHRDDWQVTDKEGRNLAHYTSRGEHRSIIITLKLQELLYLQETLDKVPIILLDELLAELDNIRKRKVLENLPEDTQKFFTTTDLREIPDSLLEKAQVIEFNL